MKFIVYNCLFLQHPRTGIRTNVKIVPATTVGDGTISMQEWQQFGTAYEKKLTKENPDLNTEEQKILEKMDTLAEKNVGIMYRRQTVQTQYCFEFRTINVLRPRGSRSRSPRRTCRRICRRR
jgi:hypothetical protein